MKIKSDDYGARAVVLDSETGIYGEDSVEVYLSKKAFKKHGGEAGWEPADSIAVVVSDDGTRTICTNHGEYGLSKKGKIKKH